MRTIEEGGKPSVGGGWGHLRSTSLVPSQAVMTETVQSFPPSTRNYMHNLNSKKVFSIATSIMSTFWINELHCKGGSSSTALASSSFLSIRKVGTAGTIWSSRLSPPMKSGLPWIVSPFSTSSALSSSGLCFGRNDNNNFWNRNVVPTAIDASDDNNAKSIPSEEHPIRIAIVGGGIAGITAASSIAKRLQSHHRTPQRQNAPPPPYEIVVFEADTNASSPYPTTFTTSKWTAATALNANSIVPAASMHILAQRSTLLSIAKDTVMEWTMLHNYEWWQNIRSMVFKKEEVIVKPNIDNFDVVPPYFAFHLVRCLGYHATWEERGTFITFLKNFLLTSLTTTPAKAHNRGQYIVQLAKANRYALLQDFTTIGQTNPSQKEQLGINHGFLSLHRTKQSALHAVEEANEFDEITKLMDWEEAITLEPHIENLPFGPLFVVHRPNDVTANCLRYVHNLKERCKTSLGIEFREQDSGIVQDIEHVNTVPSREEDKTRKTTNIPAAAAAEISTTDAQQAAQNESNGRWSPAGRFRIHTADNTQYETDYVILAAGINTPLLARKLHVGHCCPTYPLRGYSLTLHTEPDTTETMDQQNDTKKKNDDGNKKTKSTNLLNRPISVDSMYCSSVTPTMARLAGYGELVGYRDCARDVPSVGPRVLSRYGQTLFPSAAHTIREEDAKQCFRPMSPDDLPLVGKVGCCPGLYLHNGHGQLGWTTSLATAECLAQSLCEDLLLGEDEKGEEKMFVLPDGSRIARSVLSPDRFA